jgi:two-component system OmpR family response regulator
MRVLVVEDEPDLQSVLAQCLREEGYAIDTASDGSEGLIKAKGVDYDAIVLDVMMPKLDGIGMLKKLREAGRTTAVLLLTARDALHDRVKGLDAGADDYLVKPFELSELLARLRALIRRSAGKASAQIVIGDLLLDTAAKQVLRDGKAIALTAREYTLVELLAMHRGELVSRSMIYDHLFDEDDDSLSNLVDVHVSNVRKKLGKGVISTRRGQGYMIGGEANAEDSDDV